LKVICASFKFSSVLKGLLKYPILAVNRRHA
jgi:hypothetical protein